MVTRKFELVICGFELVTFGLELVTREFELVTRRFELPLLGFQLVLLSFQLVTRVLPYHLLLPVFKICKGLQCILNFMITGRFLQN